MVTVLFYEKPGCASNARQKQILRQAGVTLDVRNLLTENWTAPRLRAFFGTRPVADWFNPSAPAIKDGAVDPQTLDADSALAAMLQNPILIRRPLIATGIAANDFHCSGFDWPTLVAALDLHDAPVPRNDTDLESCSHVQPNRCHTSAGGAE